MAENKLKIQHLRSKELVDGKPKLPTELDEGEIAINFATGHETIAIKNDRNQIVKFDNKVDENYEQTHYTDRFDDLVDNNVVTNNDGDHLNTHIKGGDNIGFAFKKTEGTINKLVEEIYDNEEITAKSIGTLGNATGVINDKGIIGYQKENDSNYIAGANSIHEATMMLDDELSTIDSKAMNIATATGVINAQDVIGYQKETGVHYIKDATSVHDATVKLDFKLQEIESDLANVIGGAVRNSEKRYEYTPEETANYIADATSVHDATVKLDNVLGPINTTVRQWCPISLDFVELNGIKWLKYDFNDFIGHTYQWGSLGDEPKSPFPSFNIDSDTNEPQENPAWTAIKSIVAPLSSNNEDEASVERTRLLSPSFDIIYHLTHGHARMARELEYKSLNQNNIQQIWFVGVGPVVSPKWRFSYKENPKNFITLDAGVYKPSEIGAMVTVSHKDNSRQINSAIQNGSSPSYEGRIMGVLIK